MYYLRLSFLKREKINPQSVATSRQMLEAVPETVNNSSDNLKNLFELPVIFYVLCIFLFITQKVDSVNLVLAYCFVIFRIGHSVIHCTYNKVIHRFFVYMLSSFILWALVIRSILLTINI